MISAIGTVLTVLFTFFWDERVLLVLSDGRTVTPRDDAEGWSPSYCNNRTPDMAGDERCEDLTCAECFRSWAPGHEYPQQGGFNYWHAQQVNMMQAELEALRYKVEHDMIEIAHVQQVAHDYAVHGEWCSVYEQALETLSRVSGKTVEPLDATTDITVTYTVNMTVRADRRQRVGDIDFLRQSIRQWSIDEVLERLDPFDSDYEMESATVISVEIEEQ
jgi:hypothetical protein